MKTVVLLIQLDLSMITKSNQCLSRLIITATHIYRGRFAHVSLSLCFEASS